MVTVVATCRTKYRAGIGGGGAITKDQSPGVRNCGAPRRAVKTHRD